jgi:FPC/CPF motif-containing protein YcgG
MAPGLAKIFKRGGIARGGEGLESRRAKRQCGGMADAGRAAGDQDRAGKRGIYHSGISIHPTLRHLGKKENLHRRVKSLRHEGHQYPVAQPPAMP